ncbi:TIGR00282 family metallophosphoesterase [Hydrogenobaculum acidophilum]
MNILAIGDVIGRTGRRTLKAILPKVIKEYEIDFILLNCENAAGGFGITLKVYEELKALGIDVFTSGNHIWDNKEIFTFIDQKEDILRPANYPQGVPGMGFKVFNKSNKQILVINLMGKVFMGNPALENPFFVARDILNKNSFDIAIIDFHAEATAEKYAFALYIENEFKDIANKIFIYGTHTHVPTADALIFPSGMAYVTDIGMTGAWHSIIGTEYTAITKYLKGIPARFEVDESQGIFNAILLKAQDKIESINRLQIFEDII